MTAARALPVLDDAELKLIDEDPAGLSPAEAARAGAARLAAGQPESLDRLAGSALAERLLGVDILDALLAVRRYEQDHYGHQDAAGLADRFRFAWSA